MTATAPLYIRCARCGRMVLEVRADWHDDVLIGEPRLDPVSLDRQQLTACILTGIRVWQLHQVAGSPVTSRRSRYWPRTPIAGHILPEHACARVWDAFPVDLARIDTPTPEQCPF